MDDWNEWMANHDTADILNEMQKVLSDPRRRDSDKFEALTMLANMGEDEALEILRWYASHASPAMSLTAKLAVVEAEKLMRIPDGPHWYDDVLDYILLIGDELADEGLWPLERGPFVKALTENLRRIGYKVETGGRALLKYDGYLIELAPLDMVINNELMIGFWTVEDATRYQQELDDHLAPDPDDEEAEILLTPLDRFYATLRAANLPWGMQIDISGEEIVTDLLENNERDRGYPRVEYVVGMPLNQGF